MEMDNVELATTIVQLGKQRPGGSEMVEATAERGKEERVRFPNFRYCAIHSTFRFSVVY